MFPNQPFSSLLHSLLTFLSEETCTTITVYYFLSFKMSRSKIDLGLFPVMSVILASSLLTSSFTALLGPHRSWLFVFFVFRRHVSEHCRSSPPTPRLFLYVCCFLSSSLPVASESGHQHENIKVMQNSSCIFSLVIFMDLSSKTPKLNLESFTILVIFIFFIMW